MPDAPPARDIADQMRRLLDVLHEAAGTHDALPQYTEALAVVDLLLWMLASPLVPKGVRRLAEMATAAGREIDHVTRDLAQAWAKLSPRLGSRGRFWDKV